MAMLAQRVSIVHLDADVVNYIVTLVMQFQIMPTDRDSFRLGGAFGGAKISLFRIAFMYEGGEWVRVLRKQ